MPVKSIPRYDLLSAEVATTAKNLSVILEKASLDATLLHTLNNDMKNKISALEERSGKKAQLTLVETPAVADSNRDSIYNQILQYVKGSRHNPKPEVAKAAEKMYELLVQHNTGLTNLAYDVESHYINALIVDLKKSDFQEVIATLGLESTVNNLETAQHTFESANSEKIEQNAAFDLPQLQTLVAPIRSILFEILVHLGTIERFNPDIYATIVKETNELITEVTSKVKARRTRKNKSETAANVAV